MIKIKPEKTFQNGSCIASVFSNEITRDGKKVEIKKVSIQKRYLDKEQKWRSTNSYGINDLPKLMVVVRKAYDYLTSKN